MNDGLKNHHSGGKDTTLNSMQGIQKHLSLESLSQKFSKFTLWKDCLCFLTQTCNDYILYFSNKIKNFNIIQKSEIELKIIFDREKNYLNTNAKRHQ